MNYTVEKFGKGEDSVAIITFGPGNEGVLFGLMNCLGQFPMSRCSHFCKNDTNDKRLRLPSNIGCSAVQSAGISWVSMGVDVISDPNRNCAGTITIPDLVEC